MHSTTNTRETATAEAAALAIKSKRGEPTWELAMFYPKQGEWTEETVLALHFEGQVELSDGCLEFLPMATMFHQRIVEFIYLALKLFVDARKLGEVKFSPLPIRLWPGKLRDPDITFFRPGRVRDPHSAPDGADLAVEVVSEGEEAHERDLIVKRQEYARARIAEYWIVEPQQRHISVLVLEGTSYREHGVFAVGQDATSAVLPGFSVSVKGVFAAGQGEQG